MEPHQIMTPPLKSMTRLRLSTGRNHEAVVLSMPNPVNLILFTPMEARALGARLLEEADKVDGGKGLA